MTPKEIVSELDKHIVGQGAAKRSVAIALRNRWRRMQIEDPLRQEITPKNILMIGPTGCGKTEIARRLARLAKAPFVKVEATKFTEVGYVGREVDSIIKELADVAVKMTREEEKSLVRERAADAAEERILDVLLPKARPQMGFSTDEPQQPQGAETRQRFRKMLREGSMDDREIELLAARQLQRFEAGRRLHHLEAGAAHDLHLHEPGGVVVVDDEDERASRRHCAALTAVAA